MTTGLKINLEPVEVTLSIGVALVKPLSHTQRLDVFYSTTATTPAGQSMEMIELSSRLAVESVRGVDLPKRTKHERLGLILPRAFIDLLTPEDMGKIAVACGAAGPQETVSPT